MRGCPRVWTQPAWFSSLLWNPTTWWFCLSSLEKKKHLGSLTSMCVWQMYRPRRAGGTGRRSCWKVHELYPPRSNWGWSNKKDDVGGARSMHATDESCFRNRLDSHYLHPPPETSHAMLQFNWSMLFNLGLFNIHSGGEYFGSWLGQQLFWLRLVFSGEFWDRSSDEIGHIRFPPHPYSLPSPVHHIGINALGLFISDLLAEGTILPRVCIKQVGRHVFSGSQLGNGLLM